MEVTWYLGGSGLRGGWSDFKNSQSELKEEWVILRCDPKYQQYKLKTIFWLPY
jgi:hypothetical protein